MQVNNGPPASSERVVELGVMGATVDGRFASVKSEASPRAAELRGLGAGGFGARRRIGLGQQRGQHLLAGEDLRERVA